MFLFCSASSARAQESQASFASEIETEGFEPWVLVGASNLELVRKFVPDGLRILIEQFGLELMTAPYEPVLPSNRFAEMTEKNKGKAKAIETKDIRTKGIEGYQGGLPFVAPRTGLEVMWNQFFSYQGDDGFIEFDVFVASRGLGVERHETWRWEFVQKGMYRTDLPSLPEFEKRGIVYASRATCLRPQEKAHTVAVQYRYDKPNDQIGYIYVPFLMRPIKVVVGAVGVSWNQTDMLFEDIKGYSLYPEWTEWKLLGKRTILAPMHPRVKSPEDAIDLQSPPGFKPQLAFEPRQVYVVEGRSKFFTSQYGKVIMYVDAETFYIPVKEAYDKDGKLWKVFLNVWDASKGSPPPFLLALAVDVQHSTSTLFVVENYGFNVGYGFEDFDVTRVSEGD
jgi:hypothetical protein